MTLAPAIPALHEFWQTELDRLLARLPRDRDLTPADIAPVMGRTPGTVRVEMATYDQLMHNGEYEAAARYVPCLHTGGTRRDNGRPVHGKYTVPRMTFVWWYITGGHRFAAEEGEAA